MDLEVPSSLKRKAGGDSDAELGEVNADSCRSAKSPKKEADAGKGKGQEKWKVQVGTPPKTLRERVVCEKLSKVKGGR